MLPVLRNTVAAFAATIALTACSTGDDVGPVETQESSETPSNAAATPDVGTLVGSDVYALTLPLGWTETETASEDQLFAVSDQTPDGVPTSVSVVEDTTLVQQSPDQLSAERTEVLQTGGLGVEPPTDVTAVGEYEVDGDEGMRLTYLQDVTDVPLRFEEISVSHDDTAFVITFSFAPSVSDEARAETISTIMDSWTWAQ